MATREKGVYVKKELPTNPREWKKWNEERKSLKRKWKEGKLLSQLEEWNNLEEKKTKAAKEEEEQEKKQLGRLYTLAIAVPGSILDNAQSPELRTYLAGQIARAAVVFNVDEIIIFDESGSTTGTVEGEFTGIKKHGEANVQLARLLQYLECPQYLRKFFFPQHKDLQYAGLLNPLDCPHHMRAADVCTYREGVVLNKPVKDGRGSFVNAGLQKEVQIDKQLQSGLRVTVKLDNSVEETKIVKCKVVSPAIPRTDAGIYWGYSVRLARSLGAVFTESPHTGGYDLTIGTSERGQDIDECSNIAKFSHGLVVFGGVQGLEASLEADEALKINDPSLLFTHYLNTCPSQGSRTIRTEEAILITLSSLRPKIQQETSTQNNVHS